MKWTGSEPDPADSRNGAIALERAWNSVCTAMIGVGVIAAIAWCGWSSPAAAFAVATFTFWVFALCLVEDFRSRMPQLLEWSLIAPTALVAMFGFWALVQGWSIVIALVLAGCHRLVVSTLRKSAAADAASECLNNATATTDAASPSSAHPAAKSPALGRPTRLSDDALRQCWQASWTLLQRAKTLDEAMRIVDYRRTCLDEIARRNADAVELWLEAGAPNVDEPARRLPPTFKAESPS